MYFAAPCEQRQFIAEGDQSEDLCLGNNRLKEFLKEESKISGYELPGFASNRIHISNPDFLVGSLLTGDFKAAEFDDCMVESSTDGQHKSEIEYVEALFEMDNASTLEVVNKLIEDREEFFINAREAL